MNRIKRIGCYVVGHKWQRDDGKWPVHGYHDEPIDGSYCGRCKFEVHYR